MRSTIPAAALVVLLASGLAGCSQTDPFEEGFDSMKQAVETVGANGYECDDYTDREEENDAELFQEFGWANHSCGNGNVTFWESDARRQEVLYNGKNDLDAGWCRLHGRNWTVTSTQFRVEDLRAEMGGGGELECA